jgi:ADP-ribosylglycohydrolase
MIDLKSNLMFNFELAKSLLVRSIDTIHGIEEIGNDGASVRLIPGAFYAFLKNPTDFEGMILACVNAGGDTDSRAAIAGYISGAFNGIDAIPQSWIRKIEDKNLILDRAEKLYDLTVNSQV